MQYCSASDHEVFYDKETVQKQVSKMVFSTMRYALPAYFQDQQVVAEIQHLVGWDGTVGLSPMPKRKYKKINDVFENLGVKQIMFDI